MNNLSVALIVPTLNAGELFREWVDAYSLQTKIPDYPLVIDSSSDDNTLAVAQAAGFAAHVIARDAFDHGATRQLGLDLVRDAQIYVFLTQDAILARPDALARLIACFADAQVGAVYGRQIPHPNARPIGAHARLFNYPAHSQIRSIEDRGRFGIKTAFTSNSFAAYRRDALDSVGGFPSKIILNEEGYVVGKMLQKGWRLQYCADAQAFHSHDYRFLEEFKRYFDIGTFNSREPWFQETFGTAEGEGKRYVFSEVRYLLEHAPHLIPSAMLRTAIKFTGYKLGLAEKQLPTRLKRRISMNRGFWR